MPKAIWIGYRFDLKGSITNESGGLSRRVYLIQFEYTSRPVKTLEVCVVTVEALKGPWTPGVEVTQVKNRRNKQKQIRTV